MESYPWTYCTGCPLWNILSNVGPLLHILYIQNGPSNTFVVIFFKLKYREMEISQFCLAFAVVSDLVPFCARKRNAVRVVETQIRFMYYR